MSSTPQVWYREGIHPRVPEGSTWEEVEVPKEVAQLSAGPGDLLWAVLWDGNLLVRKGLSLDSPSGQPETFTCNVYHSRCCRKRPNLMGNNVAGTLWVEVESPGKESEALHVAVGVSVVWVVTKDYKVLRKILWKKKTLCC